MSTATLDEHDLDAAADALDFVRTYGLEGAREVDAATYRQLPPHRRAFLQCPEETHLHLIELPDGDS